MTTNMMMTLINYNTILEPLSNHLIKQMTAGKKYTHKHKSSA